MHVTEIINPAKQDHGIKLSRDSIDSALLKEVNADQRLQPTAPNTFALAKEGP